MAPEPEPLAPQHPRPSRPLRGRGRGRGRGEDSTNPGPSRIVTSQTPAEIVVPVLGGTIRYHSTTNHFSATCSNPFHGKCTLWRTRSHAAHMGGKPCALMKRWLEAGVHCDGIESHWDMIDTLAMDAESLERVRSDMYTDSQLKLLVQKEDELLPRGRSAGRAAA